MSPAELQALIELSVNTGQNMTHLPDSQFIPMRDAYIANQQKGALGTTPPGGVQPAAAPALGPAPKTFGQAGKEATEAERQRRLKEIEAQTPTVSEQIWRRLFGN